MNKPKKFTIQPQPNETTCGPTCLHAVYNYYGDDIDLHRLVKEVRALKGGGTLAVLLGIHALKMGYKARLYSYNLRIFDPTWSKISQKELMSKLDSCLGIPQKPKMKLAMESYREFLELGGSIHFDELSPELIIDFLEKQKPILTGLSATYLYRSMREQGDEGVEDDIRGEPQGHFVVLYDYLQNDNKVMLADPWSKNPFDQSLNYKVSMQRLLNAILLGVLTYDGNLLILTPHK